MTDMDMDTGEIAETDDIAVDAETRQLAVRMTEALIFATEEPVAADVIAAKLPDGVDVADVLSEVQAHYAGRGVDLVNVGGRWRFRTAEDLAFVLRDNIVVERRLSRAALETLAIIGYHQPVTRAEIEEIRGVSTSKSVMDTLLETGWIRMRGRRRTPGRPITFGTTDAFLDHFGLESLKDLPGVADLKAAGLMDAVPSGNPNPFKDEAEDPLDVDALDLDDDADSDQAVADRDASERTD